MNTYPKHIKFTYDYECNINCKICRNKIKRLSDEELKNLNEKIDTLFLPLLKDTEILMINSAGDPFASRHSRLVIKKATEKYPNLKFEIHTNGILCNEYNFKQLGITPEKIAAIRISIHAASAKTYSKIVEHGEFYFDKIINNIKYLSELKKLSDFNIYTHMVILPDNFEEIPQFIKLAEEFGTIPAFWEFRQANCSYDNKEDLYIYKPEHPLFKDLCNVLNQPIVKMNKAYFSPCFYKLIP